MIMFAQEQLFGPQVGQQIWLEGTVVVHKGGPWPTSSGTPTMLEVGGVPAPHGEGRGLKSSVLAFQGHTPGSPLPGPAHTVRPGATSSSSTGPGACLGPSGPTASP